MALLSLDEYSILNNSKSDQTLNSLDVENSKERYRPRRMFFDGRKIGDNKIGGKKGENFGSFDNCISNYINTEYSTKRNGNSNKRDMNTLKSYEDGLNCNSNKIINNNNNNNNNDDNNNNNNMNDKINNNNNNINYNSDQFVIEYRENEFDCYRVKFIACEMHLTKCESALKRLELLAGKQTANMGLVVYEPEIFQK